MSKLFSEIEIRRYARHINSPDIGLQGQEKLKQSKVLVIGAGSMGIPVLQYMASAGVGVLGICDYKTIKEADFPAQVMFGLGDLGKLKTIVAKEKLQLLNPFITIQIHNIQLRHENVQLICEGYDLIVDCTNEPDVAPLLINSLNVPLVIGRLTNLSGEIWIIPHNSHRTLPDELKAPEATSVTWGSLCGTLGSLIAYQSMQVILAPSVSVKHIKVDFNALNTLVNTISNG